MLAVLIVNLDLHIINKALYTSKNSEIKMGLEYAQFQLKI